MHIYKFTHLESGRSYIGQTIQDPNRRRLEHICDSRHTKRTYHFHNALRKYGIDSFFFEVIAKASDLKELNSLEEYYVTKFDSIQNGFNIRNPGDNKTHNPESIARMQESQKKAHARRREMNGGVEKTAAHKKHVFTKPSPLKGKSHTTKGVMKGKTWEEIYGVEGAAIRREQHRIRKQLKEASV
jgi:group I intron endonuclease